MVQQVRYIRAFGRLSLRSTERFSIAHLYFRAGRLMHAAGNRGDIYAILTDVREWQQGVVRFDRGITTMVVTLGDEQEQMFLEMLQYLQHRGVVRTPALPRVIDGRLISTVGEVEQLIAPGEWRLVVEAIRRVSLAVSRVVGPGEALQVLQDIIEDCAVAFPAFACLKVATSGYLQVTDFSHFDRIPRQELLEGFTVLISTCQYFCATMIGEYEAQRLIIQALDLLISPLAHLGVYRVDQHLLPALRHVET
jgi:hypothetical protein